VPLFDRYGVDIVFNGHSHNYMRSRPVNWTASTTEPQPSYLEGAMYVVAGAWGAPLYEPVGGWWVEDMSMTTHFVLVDLYTNGSLHLQAIDVEGETFDEAWIEKALPDSEEQLAQRLYALSREMDAKIAEISELGSRVESLSAELNATASEVSSLNALMGELEEERDDLAAAKSELEAEIEALSAQFTSERSLLEERIDELEAETRDLEAKVRELESQPAPEDRSAQTTLLTLGLIASILILAYLYYLLLKSGRS
jgi:outer membrane murein-binding lipoprotein Lpp